MSTPKSDYPSVEFARTYDHALIRQVLTHPRLYDAISDDFAPAREAFEPSRADLVHYIRVDHEGVFLGIFVLLPIWREHWQLHTCLLPVAWGKAVIAAQALFAWIFATTACLFISTNVPAYNRLALRAARHAGMTEYGRSPKTYRKRGERHDEILLGISKQDPILCPS